MQTTGRRKVVRYQMVLDPETDTMLRRLADDYKLSRSAMARQLILERHEQRYGRVDRQTQGG